MADTPNGDGYGYNFDRRLDRINDTIVSLVSSLTQMREFMQESHKLATARHDQTMEEIRELITLQREHRIDIMALFEVNKQTRQRLEKREGGSQ